MRSVVLVSLLCGVACIAPQPVLLPPTGDDVTIFLHGYRGSFLATESGELAYVTVGDGLSKGERSLAFPFEGQREFPKYGPVHVTGPLTAGISYKDEQGRDSERTIWPVLASCTA